MTYGEIMEQLSNDNRYVKDFEKLQAMSSINDNNPIIKIAHCWTKGLSLIVSYDCRNARLELWTYSANRSFQERYWQLPESTLTMSTDKILRTCKYNQIWQGCRYAYRSSNDCTTKISPRYSIWH